LGLKSTGNLVITEITVTERETVQPIDLSIT